MKRKMILMVSVFVILILSLNGFSFAAEKKTSTGKAASSEKEFTGGIRGSDGVGRVFWIRGAEGKEELTFTCDEKSLLINNKGKRSFSDIGSKEFFIFPNSLPFLFDALVVVLRFFHIFNQLCCVLRKKFYPISLPFVYTQSASKVGPGLRESSRG